MPELTAGPDCRRAADACAATCWQRVNGTLDRLEADASLRATGPLPAARLRPAHLAGDAAGLPLDQEPAEDARRLRPQHLRPERAAGPPADRGRHARRAASRGHRTRTPPGTRTATTSPSCKDELLPQLDAGVLGAARRPAPTAGCSSGRWSWCMGEFGRTPKINASGAAATTGPSATRCCWPAAA